MSIVLITSLGDIVIDFFTKTCPNHSLNFIKLCKLKYYNNCLFFNVQKDYLCQSGSPYLDETKNTSIFEIVNKKNNKFFSDEISSKFKHNQIGLVCSSNIGPNLNTSGFYITLTNKELLSLNGKHTIFGKVVEGLEVLNKINNCYTDENNRPYQNIRIKHTLIIDDPFDDLPGMIIPNSSPEHSNIEHNNIYNTQINNPKYLEDTFNIKKLFNEEEITENLLKEKLKEQESKNQALILELLDDLPDSEIKPPENILFVCKLNPITTDEDLENIFERFGHIKSCQIIRDKKTGESLQYAFIEFEKVEDCEKAYLKMNGVLVDDKRIKVDFSQSVSKFWMNNRNNNKNNNNEGNDLKLNVKLKIKENKNFNIINGIGNKDKNNKNYGMVLSNDNYNKKNNKINIQYNINKQYYDKINKIDNNYKKKYQRSRSNSKSHHKHHYKHK